MGNVNKARYWVAICYPENMVEDWQDQIGDLIQYPYAYCIHDKDHLGKYKAKRKSDQDRQRKVHVHIFVAFPDTTTKKHFEELIDSLSAEGKKCSPGGEAVVNPKNKYDYLIHDTETCRKQGKYVYPKSERIEGNNFDIGSYIQISVKDIRDIKKELAQAISDQAFTNFFDFYFFVVNNFDDTYFDVVTSYSSFFEKIIKGLYLKIRSEGDYPYQEPEENDYPYEG